MIAFVRERACGALIQWRARSWLADGCLTVVGAYLIHFAFTKLFLLTAIPAEHILRPTWRLPVWILQGWDTAYYRELFHSIDRYPFPPLYPLTLRLISFIGHYHKLAFERSAVVLNLLSHVTIAAGIAYYLRKDERTKDTPAWAVALLILFFPWHNVFFAAYSESYFLALTLIAFCLRAKGWIGWGSLLAGVSALVRTMGTFLVLAFVAEQLFYSVRERQVRWRKLLLALPGLAVVAGWHLFLGWHGTTVERENAPWVDSLVQGAVPPHQNPYLWVLRYLCFAGRPIDVLPFWVGLIALAYCAVKRRPLEFCYIAVFYLSLAIHIYRPFAWSRYVSVLFPVQVMVADLLKNRPRSIAVLLVLSVVHSYRIQIELFSGRAGEP